MLCRPSLFPGRGRRQVIYDRSRSCIADQVKVFIFIHGCDPKSAGISLRASMANISKNRLSAVGAANEEK